MKVYYHHDFNKEYTNDPAAKPGRLEPTVIILKDKHTFVDPRPALYDEVIRVHTPDHWQRISREPLLFNTALLAVGASINAAESAVQGEHSFALCRPPGHHASTDSCWGFCYFNNIAIAVQYLFDNNYVKNALIVDFDLHFGDGTANIFRDVEKVSYWQGKSNTAHQFIANLKHYLQSIDTDLVAVSAGFDRHVEDWGGMFTTKDYYTIGRILDEYTSNHCQYGLFAVLEGGYNATALARNIDAFLDGLQNKFDL